MKTNNRSNALLMELLIVIGVFMLAAALLMRLFAGIHGMEERSRLIAVVLPAAQSQADRLYAAEEPEEALRQMGYVQADSGWVCQSEGYISTVTLRPGENGWMDQELTVRDGGGEVLLTLPCSRWREVQP